jgi:nucleoside-diphosphate-sugar epimerase
VGTERDPSPNVGPDAPRGGAERLALSYAERGVRSVALRFAPTVHGMGDHGFVARLTQVAAERGVAAYIGDGQYRWAAVHRGDAATMVRLALEQAPAGSAVHAVAEAGVPTRDIATAIAERLGVPTVSLAPDDAPAHFGWIGRFFGLDLAASSELTQELLGWTPTGPTLLADIAAGAYA